MKFPTIIFVSVAGVLCQGCIVFPYPTPEVKGVVIDASTRQPIANVRIQVRHHIHIHCRSAADGSFDLPAGNAWDPCFLLPGDIFAACADVSFKTDGYQTVIKSYASPMSVPLRPHSDPFLPVVLDQPIELQKEASP